MVKSSEEGYYPKSVTLFRSIGEEQPHLQRPGETMSWGNVSSFTYIRSDQLSEMRSILYDNR